MEQLKHECGIALIRLLKPLEYYKEHYGTWMYGLNKLYLLMEKQHNRGQEGAGLACVKLEASAGEEYMFRERALGTSAITEIFASVGARFKDYSSDQLADASFARRNLPFAGEIYMGHLRYSTTGRSGLSFVHPFLRRNNWRAKNLALCGNFNMTNVDEVFADITSKGQHPRVYSDTYILLEQVGHRLDRESERLYGEAVSAGLSGVEITDYIEGRMDMARMLRSVSGEWDGGYVLCGVTGSGESFVMRDPWGIRTAFWYRDEEVVVVASERPVIQTVFGVEADAVTELNAGEGLFVTKGGVVRRECILESKSELKACSFERIYFSRGSDKDIYRERKSLGRQLRDPILRSVGGDLQRTVFSFIPNTAEVAFYGMLDAMKEHLNETKIEQLERLDHMPSHDELRSILRQFVRSEKVAIKDIKLRTFITEGNSRNDLAAHVYDVTYGCLVAGVDNLVVIDDSIVRGTTLKESIIRILDRLHPRKIVIVSSSPQVRYPDFYGIDMAGMAEFIAFRAAIELLIERGMWSVVSDVYLACCRELDKVDKCEMVNCVKAIYDPFSDDEISHKMVEMLRPAGVKTPIDIVFQTLDGLHRACPHHGGDWYFSGDYPTPGGVKLVNKSFVDYYERIFLGRFSGDGVG